MCDADNTEKATAKQLEVVGLECPNKTIGAEGQEKEKKAQLKAEETQRANEAVKANAKKLAANARVAYRKERKKYAEGRAQDIRENTLQCKPFDNDAVREGGSPKRRSEMSSRS